LPVLHHVLLGSLSFTWAVAGISRCTIEKVPCLCVHHDDIKENKRTQLRSFCKARLVAFGRVPGRQANLSQYDVSRNNARQNLAVKSSHNLLAGGIGIWRPGRCRIWLGTSITERLERRLATERATRTPSSTKLQPAASGIKAECGAGHHSQYGDNCGAIQWIGSLIILLEILRNFRVG
jgi:hypothetical protein